jgi:two-component system, cell cycle response regulator
VSYVFSRFEQLKASGALPTASGVALEILRLSQSEEATVDQLVHVLHADPALAGRLVKFANSTQTSATRPVVSIADAVKLLGFAVVRQLCLGFSVLDAHRKGGCAGFDYPRFWSRSLATALAAQRLCLKVRVLAPEEGFTCGLLADIGSLALASLYPEKFTEVLASGAIGPDLSSAEREVFGVDHLEFGAALLEDWRLPRVCVDAVFHSEMPEQTVFKAASRPQMLWELVSLSRRVGEYFVADIDARQRIAPIMLLRAARIGVDADALAQLCDSVGEGWRRWGSLLGIPAGTAPRLDLQDVDRSIDAGLPPRTSVPATALPAGTDGAEVDAEAAVVAVARLKVHVVSDDRFSGGRLRELLVGAGHEVVTSSTADVALAAALDQWPDVMVIDLDRAGTDWQRLCTGLRAASAGERIYIIGTLVAQADADPVPDTALPLYQGVVIGPDAGPDDYLPKPIDRLMLQLRIRAARRTLALREALRREQDDLRRLASELATANRRLQRSVLTDAITGLPNRRHALERLEQEWAATSRTRRPISCMAIDVDHFRRLNAAYGHAAGDRALGAVSALLRESARANDVICRLAGEEFLMISPDADGAAAMKAASRLRMVVEQRFGPGPVGSRQLDAALTLSIGVATRDASVRDAEALLRLACEALRTAKEAGRNRVHCAQTVIDSPAGVSGMPAAG